EPYTTEPWTALLAREITARRPKVVLLPSSYFGRDLAPRLAGRLGLGLTGDCIDLAIDAEGRLVQWRPAFGGSSVAPIYSRTVPEMATVRPGMLDARPAAPSRRATIETIEVGELAASRTRVVERRPIPGAERA